MAPGKATLARPNNMPVSAQPSAQVRPMPIAPRILPTHFLIGLLVLEPYEHNADNLVLYNTKYSARELMATGRVGTFPRASFDIPITHTRHGITSTRA